MYLVCKNKTNAKRRRETGGGMLLCERERLTLCTALVVETEVAAINGLSSSLKGGSVDMCY